MVSIMWVFFTCSEYALSQSTVMLAASSVFPVWIQESLFGSHDSCHVLIYSIRHRIVDVSVLAEQNRNYCAMFTQNCRCSPCGADFDLIVFVARTTQSMVQNGTIKSATTRC
ncbi:hypothetical protein EV702DRAFT_255458 [Suillus placidus]|uniref:Secreted protein n=1 Tax=Suillus placidus TaxID=48579 RepID=A0A9P7A828_9AGAM|nr:hypothetical protein EV702DRAFT_255458 [Suillus placidus]